MEIKSSEQILSESLGNMDPEQIKNFVVESRVDQLEKDERREEYVMENKENWLKNGKKLRARREIQKMSMRRVADILGTSATRIGRLEKGDPVSMANNLTKTYNLLFDHIELREAFRKLFEDNYLSWRL